MRGIKSYLKMNDVEYEENLSFKVLSTIRLGGYAELVAYPDGVGSLIRLIDFLSESDKKFKVIGKMSNILPPDGRYRGVLVRTDKLNEFHLEGETLCSECGISFPLLVNRLASIGVGGLEELSGIPGTLGGIVVGNSGAFGKEIADVIIKASAYDIKRRKVLALKKEDLDFAYRTSVFKHKPLVLLSATLLVKHQPKEKIKEKIQAFREIRRAKQPSDPSLGSTFKRPDGAYASQLIDELGLRGYTIGGAEISQKHAGFIINNGNATSADIKELIEYVGNAVFENFGIRLEKEIEYLE